MDEKELSILVNNLKYWFIRHDYKGIDPYQMDERVFGIIKEMPWLGFIRKTLKPFQYLMPKSLFRNSPRIYHPKAIALIISANCYLYYILKDKNLIEENFKLLKILDSLKNPKFKYACWGHPFEWGQNPRYPKDTPLICVQAPIAHSLIDFYSICKDKRILDMIESAANYLSKEADYEDFGKTASFHNSPLDDMYVHNSNIMAAAFFYRLNEIKKDQNLIVFADKLTNFTINSQNQDGSWFYAHKKSGEIIKTIDNCHTGFVLKALNQIRNISKSEKIKHSLDKGMDFYNKNMFDRELPKHTVQNEYPIDIHDVAQAIITFTETSDLKFANKIASFAFNEMSNKKDEFYFKYFKSGKTNKLVFARWGQAWMLLALANLLFGLKKQKI
jgi:hypothetical protein